MSLRAVALLIVLLAVGLAPTPASPELGRHEARAAAHLGVAAAVIPRAPAPPALATAVVLPPEDVASAAKRPVPVATYLRCRTVDRPPAARRNSARRDARRTVRRQRTSAHLPRLEPDPRLS